MPWKNQNKIGFTDLVLPEGLLELLKDDINGSRPSDLSDVSSGSEWAAVCQIKYPKSSGGKNALGDSRYSSDGEEKYESRRHKQIVLQVAE